MRKNLSPMQATQSRTLRSSEQKLSLIGLGIDYPLEEKDRELITLLGKAVLETTGGDASVLKYPTKTFALFFVIIDVIGNVSCFYLPVQ